MIECRKYKFLSVLIHGNHACCEAGDSILGCGHASGHCGRKTCHWAHPDSSHHSSNNKPWSGSRCPYTSRSHIWDLGVCRSCVSNSHLGGGGGGGEEEERREVIHLNMTAKVRSPKPAFCSTIPVQKIYQLGVFLDFSCEFCNLPYTYGHILVPHMTNSLCKHCSRICTVI